MSALKQKSWTDSKRPLYQIARQQYDDASGDESAALVGTIRAIEHDKELRDAIVETAAWEAVTYCRRKLRNRIMLTVSSEHTDEGAEERRAAEIAAGPVHLRTWMNYPLSCCKPLGAATRDDIEAEIEMHRGFIHGHKQKLAIFNAILPRVDRGKTVAESLTEEDIARIARKVVMS